MNSPIARSSSGETSVATRGIASKLIVSVFVRQMRNPTPRDLENNAASGRLENTGPLDPNTSAFNKAKPNPSAAADRPSAGGIIRKSKSAVILSTAPAVKSNAIVFRFTAGVVANRRKFPVTPPGVTVGGVGLLP